MIVGWQLADHLRTELVLDVSRMALGQRPVPTSSDVERLFSQEIAEGRTSEAAALAVGSSQAAGSRWFRERGGDRDARRQAPLSDRYLCSEEREEIVVISWSKAPDFTPRSVTSLPLNSRRNIFDPPSDEEREPPIRVS
jgi:hypothetical protein